MNPIISLIAPAYNVEKYIEACVIVARIRIYHEIAMKSLS